MGEGKNPHKTEKVKIDIQENPCKDCDGNWCLVEYGEPCAGME